MIKRRFLFFLLISLTGFFVLPKIVLANVQLSRYNTDLLLHSVQQGLFDGWMDLTASGSFSEPEKQAALFLIRNAIQQKELNYILVELPQDFLINLVKLSAKLISSENIPLAILSEIEKKSVEKAIQMANEWLQQNEIKVATGTSRYSFKSYKGNQQNPTFYYNLAYRPLINKSGELTVEFYSPEKIEPEKPTVNVLGIGANSWEFDTWRAQGKEKIKPFIIRIKGNITEASSGGYIWNEILNIEITFSEPVPKLDIEKPLSLWEKIQKEVIDFIVKEILRLPAGVTELIENLSPQKEVAETADTGETVEDEQLAITQEEALIKAEQELKTPTAEPTPEIQAAPQSEPTGGPEMNLATMQEVLDDIAEQIDIISQEVKVIVQETGEASVAVAAKTIFENAVPTTQSEQTPPEQARPETEESEEVAESPPPESTEVLGSFSPDTSLPQILISEVAAGWDKAENEFIELYNPTNQKVSLNKYNFKLKLVNSGGKVTEKRIELGKDIPSKGYFLLVGGEISGIVADATYSDQLTSVSGVIISDGEDSIKDKVGWGKPDKSPPIEAVENTGIIMEDGLKTGKSLERINIDGNPLDTGNNSQDFTLNNNPSPTNSSGYTRLYDSTPPETVLDTTPQNPSNSAEAQFTFHSSEENSIFECKIDEQEWGVCISPKNYNGLTENNHQFQVRTTDWVGNIDQTPAIFSWTITIPEPPPEAPPPEPPPPPEPANHLLINEIQIEGATTADDWVELYNPTNQEISLSSWSIQRHSSTGGTLNKKNFEAGHKISPQGYFLVVRNDANENLKMIADMICSALQLSSDSNVYLVSNNQEIENGTDPGIVDKVGFGENPFSPEGTAAPEPPQNKSIQRKILGIDTNDNSLDFVINNTPTPTNSKGEAGPTILADYYIAENETFSLSASPYIIQNNLTVNESKTLTIEAGVSLKFGQSSKLTVNGVLKAIGTENKKIFFTRLAKDNYWQGIYFGQTSSNSELVSAQIEYADVNAPSQGYVASVLVESSSILFKNSIVKNYPARGLKLKNSVDSLVDGVQFLGPGRDDLNFIGIEIEGGQPTIKNSFIKNNYYGINIKNSSGLALVEGNNFEENKYPVWSIPRAVFKLNQGQNNTYDGIFLSGYISENLTLFPNPLPYAAYDHQIIEISQDKILTVEPGTIIKFGFRSRLEVKGRLTAQGASENLITFSSLDTSPGYWEYIYFHPSSTGSILENIIVENGGHYSWLDALMPAISVEETQVAFNNLTLRNSGRIGLYVKNSNSIIQNSQFTNNPIGIKIEGTEKYPQITDSRFENTLCDIYWADGGESCEGFKTDPTLILQNVECRCCPY